MEAKRRTLITGGTGFVGSRAVLALVAHGDHVTVVSRHPEEHRNASAVVDFAGWLPDLSRYQALVHLAGESIFGRWTDEKKRKILESRRDGTRRLVDAIERADPRPRVLVSASAIGYYGDRGDEPLPESALPGDDFMAEVCVAWEREALRAAELGVRTVCLRIGVVLGRNGGALEQMLLPFKLGLGGPIGSGRQRFSWIHARDLADLVVFATDRDELSGPVNATSPGVVTNKEFSRALGRALHRPAVIPIPPLALRLRFGEMADVLTASQRCVPEKAQAAGFPFRFPEIGGALKDVFD